MNRIVEEMRETQSLMESWGEVIDITEFMTDQTGFFNTNGLGAFTQVYDRADGRFRPVYTNESDLKLIRAMSWLLVEKVPMAQAWVNRLLDYTIGTGFDWTIKSADKRLERAVQLYVRETLDNSNWSTELERESYVREVADGEFISEHIYEDGQCLVVAREADELTEPAIKGELEDWLGIDFVPSWTFGVLTKQSLPERPIGYHFVRNAAGTDWDYVPSDRVCMWKRNVRSRGKRGFSDFYKPHLYLLRADRVLTNTAEGAATQAAIAYIVEHRDGTQRQADNIVKRFAPPTGKVDPLTGLAQRRRRMLPGTRLDVPEGQQYKAGLLGSNNSGIYIEVMESALRLAGSVHAFPEGMLTGSYANNNFASALVAEGPFMQGRLAEQAQRKERVRDLIIKVIKLAAKKRRFSHVGYDAWDAVQDLITVEVIPSRIIPIDPIKTTQALALQKQNGWVSDKTAINELGRDIDTETANGLKVGSAEQQAGAPGQPGPSGQGGPGQPQSGNVASPEEGDASRWLGLSRLQWQRNRKAVSDVLTDFANGKTRRSVAKVLLRAIGMPDQDIETILRDASDGQIDSLPPEQMESVQEAERKTLNRPFRTPDGPKKFAVYVKNEKGNVIRLGFGDPKMKIKRDNPGSRRGFRARHNCQDPGPKYKARYWSCRFWSKPSVSKLLRESVEEFIPWDGRTFVRESWLYRQNPRLLEVRDGDGDGKINDGKPSEAPAPPKEKKAKAGRLGDFVRMADRSEAEFREAFDKHLASHRELDSERLDLNSKLKAAKTHELIVELSTRLNEVEKKQDAASFNATTEFNAFHSANPERYRAERNAKLKQIEEYESKKFSVLLEWASSVRMKSPISHHHLDIGTGMYSGEYNQEYADRHSTGNTQEIANKYRAELKKLRPMSDAADDDSKVRQAYYDESENLSESVIGMSEPSVPEKVKRGGADETLRGFMSRAQVVVHVDPSVLASVATKGVLSASEGGKKGVQSKKKGEARKNYIEKRAEIENKLFGIETSATSGRPVYGLIDNPARLASGAAYASSNYGAAQVRLKPEVKARSTYTIGDSLDNNHYGGIAGPVTDPVDHSSVAPIGFFQRDEDARNNPSTTIPAMNASEFRVIVRRDRGTEERKATPPYIEAQIHGGIAPSDIAEVRVPKGMIAEATVKKFQKAGVTVVEIPRPPVYRVYGSQEWEKVGSDD
jgi:hypothetical protein